MQRAISYLMRKGWTDDAIMAWGSIDRGLDVNDSKEWLRAAMKEVVRWRVAAATL